MDRSQYGWMRKTSAAWAFTATALVGCSGSQGLNARAGRAASSSATAVVSTSRTSSTVMPTTNAPATVAPTTAVATTTVPPPTPKATAVVPTPAPTSPPPPTAPAPVLGSCEGYNFSKVPEWAAVFADFRLSVCAEGYALVNFAEAKPSLSVIAVHQTDGNNPQKLGYWTSLEDPSLDTRYTVEAVAASGMPLPIAQLLYDALGGRHPGVPAKSVYAGPGTVSSVAIAFLNAVAAGDATTAESLEAPGRSPSSYEWARDLYLNGGQRAWGVPICDGTRCDWLEAAPAPYLVIVPSGGTWVVDHPAADNPVISNAQVTGRACVIDTTPLNFRGGPGLEWPNFAAIPVGDCTVQTTSLVENASSNGRPWRYVLWNGKIGWVSDLMLRAT
jgi:hypothetical protein